jgi:hypothetical protein
LNLLSVIKAFRDETSAKKTTAGTKLKPKSAEKEPESSKKQKATSAPKKDDDLPLMQINRSKATKKCAKKNSSRKRSREVGKEDKLDADVQNAGSKKHSKADGEITPSPLDPSDLPKKQRGVEDKKSSPTLKCNQAMIATAKCGDEPSKNSNGPHGDLLGKLFSSDESTEKEKELDKRATEPKWSNDNKEEGSSDISKTSSIVDNASDDDLSAAGVLLGLGT